jgi:hypothetical protein
MQSGGKQDAALRDKNNLAPHIGILERLAVGSSVASRTRCG